MVHRRGHRHHRRRRNVTVTAKHGAVGAGGNISSKGWRGRGRNVTVNAVNLTSMAVDADAPPQHRFKLNWSGKRRRRSPWNATNLALSKRRIYFSGTITTGAGGDVHRGGQRGDAGSGAHLLDTGGAATPAT